MCQLFAGDPSTGNCTIAQLYNYVNEKSIEAYSVFPLEYEYDMLPGTLGIIKDIIPQNPKTCRQIIVYEIDATKVREKVKPSTIYILFD